MDSRRVGPASHSGRRCVGSPLRVAIVQSNWIAGERVELLLAISGKRDAPPVHMGRRQSCQSRQSLLLPTVLWLSSP